MGQWWVYILQAQDGRLYTGITTDLERRLKQHRQGPAKGGAKFFRTTDPGKVLYSERAANRSQASKREAAIKKLDRSEKLKLLDP